MEDVYNILIQYQGILDYLDNPNDETYILYNRTLEITRKFIDTLFQYGILDRNVNNIQNFQLHNLNQNQIRLQIFGHVRQIVDGIPTIQVFTQQDIDAMQDYNQHQLQFAIRRLHLAQMTQLSDDIIEYIAQNLPNPQRQITINYIQIQADPNFVRVLSTNDACNIGYVIRLFLKLYKNINEYMLQGEMAPDDTMYGGYGGYDVYGGSCSASPDQYT